MLFEIPTTPQDTGTTFRCYNRIPSVFQHKYSIAYAYAKGEDDCLFSGDGTSTYGGMTGLRTIFNGYAFAIDYALDWIGTLPYALRYLLAWNASSKGNNVDAVTGATFASHGTRSVSWDLRDAGSYATESDRNAG